jgi:hypothetical protein
MAANKTETMTYVLRASRTGGDLTLQDNEIEGLDYLLADVQVTLGRGRPE